MKYRPFVALSILLLAAAVHADEIRLKDGSKISGTIVGYEGDSFKVQTSYGFALIRKDSIAEIIPTDTKKPASAPSTASPEKPTPESASDRAPSAPAPPKPQPHPESKPGPAPSAAASMPATPPLTQTHTAPATNPLPPAQPQAALTAVAAPPPLPPTPPPPPKPEPIQETIRGNLYLNQTFGFQMFRPPGWDLIADAGQSLPNAITALGTTDETTLVVIGHDLLAGSLDAQAAATQRKLHDLYENYRQLSTGHTTLAGGSAIETHFRGGLGGHDWSVTVATLARGKESFTFLAMTYADSDLIQIRENVIAKILSTLQFTSPN